MRATRIIGGLSLLVLSGAIAWDLGNDGFWSRHALFTSLVASSIVVAVTAAVVNEVLERRQRERWSVLARVRLRPRCQLPPPTLLGHPASPGQPHAVRAVVAVAQFTVSADG